MYRTVSDYFSATTTPPTALRTLFHSLTEIAAYLPDAISLSRAAGGIARSASITLRTAGRYFASAGSGVTP